MQTIKVNIYNTFKTYIIHIQLPHKSINHSDANERIQIKIRKEIYPIYKNFVSRSVPKATQRKEIFLPRTRRYRHKYLDIIDYETCCRVSLTFCTQNVFNLGI